MTRPGRSHPVDDDPPPTAAGDPMAATNPTAGDPTAATNPTADSAVKRSGDPHVSAPVSSEMWMEAPLRVSLLDGPSPLPVPVVRVGSVGTDVLLEAYDAYQRDIHGFLRVATRDPDAAEDLTQETFRTERQDIVQRALAKLPTDDRTALLLSAHGFAGRDIAAVLGRSEGATRTLLTRARIKLRERVLELDPDMGRYA